MVNDIANDRIKQIEKPTRLTGRKRRRLRKMFNKARQGRSWKDRFIADGLKFYRSEWKRTDEPPTQAVARMLKRVADQASERGEIDLRRMDRRFWELFYSCGWNPAWRDEKHWSRYNPDALASVFDWWMRLDPVDRSNFRESSREIMALEAATERRKRRNEKSRHTL